MKRTIALTLALCLLAVLPALADAPQPLPEREALAVDLDGDGAAETVRWAMAPGDYDEQLTLTVGLSDGRELTYATDIIYAGEVYAVDLDGDGTTEILMSGDVMSDDYCTWCLRYDNGALYEVLFPDATRGDENTDGYYKTGYGLITDLGDGQVTLTGSQDVLGTWFASRTMALTAHDRFEFSDAGLWLRNLDGANIDDLWQYGALTVTTPLSYADEQGNPAGTLEPGDRILVIASDKRQFARFVTPDGSEGSLVISPDYERGWGWLVDGVPEENGFEFIPYAD